MAWLQPASIKVTLRKSTQGLTTIGQRTMLSSQYLKYAADPLLSWGRFVATFTRAFMDPYSPPIQFPLNRPTALNAAGLSQSSIGCCSR